MTPVGDAKKTISGKTDKRLDIKERLGWAWAEKQEKNTAEAVTLEMEVGSQRGQPVLPTAHPQALPASLLMLAMRKRANTSGFAQEFSIFTVAR